MGVLRILYRFLSSPVDGSVAQHRRKFPSQFKAEAIQFVFETGRPVAEIVRELEIDGGTLSNWVKTWKVKNVEPEKALTPVERVRMAEMEAEIRRLRMENEFVKKQRWIQLVMATPRFWRC